MSRQDYILRHFETYKQVYGYYPHGQDYDGMTLDQIRDETRDLEEMAD